MLIVTEADKKRWKLEDKQSEDWWWENCSNYKPPLLSSFEEKTKSLINVMDLNEESRIKHYPTDSDFLEEKLSHFDNEFLRPVVKRYNSIYERGDGRQSVRRRNANQFILGMDERRKASRSGVVLQSLNSIGLKAKRCAENSKKRLKAGGYKSVLAFLKDEGLEEPAAKEEAGRCERLICPDWWKRKLIRKSEREAEANAISGGLVSRGVAPYVSDALFRYVKARQASSLESMKQMEAVNTDTGESMDLLDILKGSVSNPEIRRKEMMLQCRGLEDAAKNNGHIAAFYTITAPSKYHATAWDKKKQKAFDNKKYNGATPKKTQAYICKLWARIRAKLKRSGVNVYGFRVAEPHHDATPHWHLLLFMEPIKQPFVTGVMKSYALAEDGNEAGAKKHRFTVELIDPEKGSATGYIAKYISKNINGYAIGEDFETGEDADTSAERVKVWASLWGIRQFQRIGGAPVGVWRELRRVDTAPDGLLEDARKAADSADYQKYLELQGGADADRKDQPLRCFSIERFNKKTGEPLTNKYGEPLISVKGVEESGFQNVITRIDEWKIQVKAKGNETSFTRMQNKFNFYESSAKSENDGFDLKSVAPRSSVNNCTESQKKVGLPERELIPDTSGYTDYLDWEPIIDDEPDFDNVPTIEDAPCMENIPDYGDLVPIDEDQSVYNYSEYEQFAG